MLCAVVPLGFGQATHTGGERTGYGGADKGSVGTTDDAGHSTDKALHHSSGAQSKMPGGSLHGSSIGNNRSAEASSARQNSVPGTHKGGVPSKSAMRNGKSRQTFAAKNNTDGAQRQSVHNSSSQ